MARSGGFGRVSTEARSWKKKTSDTSQNPVDRGPPVPLDEDVDHGDEERHHRQRLRHGGRRELVAMDGERNEAGEVEQHGAAQRGGGRALGDGVRREEEEAVVDRHQQVGQRQQDGRDIEKGLQGSSPDRES